MFKINKNSCIVCAIALILPGVGANAAIGLGSPDDFIPSLVYNALDGSLSIDTGAGYGGPDPIYNVVVQSDYGIFYGLYAASNVWYATDSELVTLPSTPLYDGTVIGNPGFMEDGEQQSFLMDDLTFIFQTSPSGTMYLGDLVYDAGIVIIPGDQDEDGFVGITDLNLILSAWNQAVPPADSRADPSDDGFVGIEDLNIVLSNWNAGTPPRDLGRSRAGLCRAVDDGSRCRCNVSYPIGSQLDNSPRV